jgi:hypothetical protein
MTATMEGIVNRPGLAAPTAFHTLLNFSNFVSQVRHDAGWIITIAPEESLHVSLAVPK